MLRLVFANENNLPLVREFRYRIFHGELGIQESSYQDMYNDHLSRTMLLYDGERMVATVRLVFGRDTQKHYISYLTIEPGDRKRSLFGLLVGAIFHVMRVNGIQAVYADSSRENLPMYLHLGCRVVGPWYLRHGFSCEFAPIVYKLGSNAQYEEAQLARARQVLGEADCSWRFPIQILRCSSPAQYRAHSARLLEERKLSGTLLHLGDAFEHRSRYVRAEMIAAPPVDAAAASGHDPFPSLNACLNDEHVILVRRDSPLALVARTYAILAGKRMHQVERWSELAWQGDAPLSALLLLEAHETEHALGCLDVWLQARAWGVMSVDSPEALSRRLLETYLRFSGPVSDHVDDHPRILGTLDGCTCTHAILGSGERAAMAQAQQQLDALLRAGHTIGAAVQQLDRATGGRHILSGDPSLRFFPEPARVIDVDVA